jgi:hypothetical protein
VRFGTNAGAVDMIVLKRIAADDMRDGISRSGALFSYLELQKRVVSRTIWICLLHHFHYVDVFPNPFILFILFQCAFLMQLLIRNLRHQPVMQFLDKSRNLF